MLLVLSTSLVSSGCAGNSDGAKVLLSEKNNGIMHTTTLYAMDTVMELQINGDEKLLTEAEQKIRNLEKTLSVTDDSSEIAMLNQNSEAQLSSQTGEILKEALLLCDRTDGALDVTIYPVLKTWGFTTGEYAVPDKNELDELLKFVDYRGVNLDETQDYYCKIPKGAQVDLGSVVKGYTSRELAAFFEENGVKSGLINLGGNVQCIGTKPNGNPWKVAIKSPYKDSASGIFGVLDAKDIAIITSGGYERYFEKDGEIYWHIIDPDNGYPAKNGLLSVTIVGKDGMVCDALSTALFVKGLDEAIDFYKKSDDFDAIIITDSDEVYVTQGIADKFTLSSEYFDAKIHIVEHGN